MDSVLFCRRMARIARITMPGVPHHVTQRGSRRLPVFFSDDDYRDYLRILGEQARRRDVEVWAYCLMPNHVHMILRPEDPSGLSRMLGEAHRIHARQVNVRGGWKGHLWQERYWSCPMDESYLVAAVRYVLLNPVRAGLVERAEHWPFSSAANLLSGGESTIVESRALNQLVTDWAPFLDSSNPESELAELRRSTSTGRPLGDARFIRRVEKVTGRDLARRPPGRPTKTSDGHRTIASTSPGTERRNR